MEKKGKREGEKHVQDGSVSCYTPPTGDLAHNAGISPDWELNP